MEITTNKNEKPQYRGKWRRVFDQLILDVYQDPVPLRLRSLEKILNKIR